MSEELSIYIHWPFCLSKCPYCDFNSYVANQFDYMLWLDSYIKEIDYFASFIKNKKINSIFFGGGTPSLMSPHLVSGLINKISSLASFSGNIEITIEANPTSFETGKFRDFKSAGVNRLSLGIQSLNDNDLKNLGREHSANEAINALKEGSKIFSNFSFDLIYAREKQKFEEWQKELKQAMNFASNHISLYQLTIEPETLFFKLFNQGKLTLPTQENAAIMYEWTEDFLANYGYNLYEISNFAKKNFESIHNLCYWRYKSYIGFGPGAHSRLHFSSKEKEDIRFFQERNHNNFNQEYNIAAMNMVKNPKNWLAAIKNNDYAIDDFKILSKEDICEELLLMSLRLKEGVQNCYIKRLTGLSFAEIFNHNMLDLYQKSDLLKYNSDNVKFTKKGLLVSSYLVPRLLRNFTEKNSIMTNENRL